MPGLADLAPAQVQASSVGAVTNPNVDVSSLGTLPEFKDFMDAYKQGVITVDDIRKRQVVGNTGYEAERARNVADKTVAEQIQLDASEVRPLQRELAKTAAEGGIEQQTVLNQINSSDPAIAIPAQQSFFKRMRQKEAVSVFGTAEPRLEVNVGAKPDTFEDWALGQVNSYRPGDNSPEANADRARYAESLARTGKDTPEYQLYAKETKARTRTLQPGTPEYDDELRRVLHEKLTHEKLQEIQLETLKEFGKAQATAQAKVAAEGVPASEHVVKEFNPATGKEDSFTVRTDKRTGQVMSKTLIGSGEPAITEFQGKAAGFAQAMGDADQILSELSPDFEPAAMSTTAQGLVPNRLKGEQVQLYNTAKSNWITGILRQQSGSAIAPHEFKRYNEQFFPQDGDSSAVIAKKKELRENQTELMRLQAGPARGKLQGGADPSSPSGGRVVAASVSVSRPTVEQKAAAPTYPSLAAVPSNVQFFKGTDGQLRVNPNFKP